MFAPNANAQLTFDDSTLGLAERERKILQNIVRKSGGGLEEARLEFLHKATGKSGPEE